MKPALFLASCCLCVLFCRAQNAPEYTWSDEQNMSEIRRLEHEKNNVYVHFEKDAQGNYQFLCDNNTFSDYTVEVSFSELSDLQADVQFPTRITVSPGRNKTLFRLKRSGPSAVPHLSYSYKAYKGCAWAKPDTAYTYLLPIAPGHGSEIVELRPFRPMADWYYLSLHVRAGDTVYAARGGRVTGALDNAATPGSNANFSEENNYIEIEHNDCTFGKYSVFKNGGIFVQPGDQVVAGQPIGIAGDEHYIGGPQVRFCVFFNREQPDHSRTWGYVPLYFWTKDNGRMRLVNRSTYVADYPADVVTREMSRKQARKWKEQHVLTSH